jgi:hypothetical protein
MLMHALAALEAASVQISVSPDRRFVAILIDYATLALFRVEGGESVVAQVEYLD